MGWFKISKGKSLDRYYLLKFCGFGVFLHKIHASDPEGLYHNHPWNGISIIFGKYIEHKKVDRSYVNNRVRRWFNFIDGVHHRVIIDKPIWTLFVHWPRCRQWSIVDSLSNIVSVEPWRGDEGVKDYSNV